MSNRFLLNWTILIAAICWGSSFLSGCYDYEQEIPDRASDEEAQYNALPAELQKIARSGSLEDQPGRLSAVVTLWNAGDIRQWAWTHPEGGAPVARYEVQATWTVPDSNTFILAATGKDSIRLRVRGIDAEGRTGPWSDVSDTLLTGRTLP